ncbi:hypothetical protein ADUPG1_007102, partial [Aduncisulcus paluster]
GMSEMTVCPMGHYCPEGSIEPIACSAGSYTAATGSSDDTMCLDCPAGSYCVEGASSPVSCVLGQYCPSKSTEPIYCEAGTYGDSSNAADPLMYIEHDVSCAACPIGKYCADPEGIWVKDCASGYICLGGATTSKPTDGIEGYPCPKGYYCTDTKESSITPCPVGTYRSHTGAYLESQCLLCPYGTYTNSVATSDCKLCGVSALSTDIEGSTSCTCIGNYRIFQPFDASCVCMSGYEYFDEQLQQNVEDGDSVIDCRKREWQRCTSSQTRLSDGSCVSVEGSPIVSTFSVNGAKIATKSSGDQVSISCSSTGCNGRTSVFNVEEGMCVCENIDSSSSVSNFVGNVCDAACRAAATTISLGSDGSLVINDALNAYTETLSNVDLNTYGVYLNEDIDVSTKCATGCDLRVVYFGADGLISAVYNPTGSDLSDDIKLGSTRDSNISVSEISLKSKKLSTKSSSLVNLKSTPSGIENPLITLQQGEGLLFMMPDGEYPSYSRQDIHNTVTDLDSGLFRYLEGAVGVTQMTTSAIFIPDQSGQYLFSSSGDDMSKGMVQVVDSIADVPSQNGVTNDLYAIPMTTETIISSNSSTTGALETEPFILGILLLVLGIFVLLSIVGIVLYCVFGVAQKRIEAAASHFTALNATIPLSTVLDGHRDCKLMPIRMTASAPFVAENVNTLTDLTNFSVGSLWDKLRDQTILLSQQMSSEHDFLMRACNQFAKRQSSMTADVKVRARVLLGTLKALSDTVLQLPQAPDCGYKRLKNMKEAEKIMEKEARGADDDEYEYESESELTPSGFISSVATEESYRKRRSSKSKKRRKKKKQHRISKLWLAHRYGQALVPLESSLSTGLTKRREELANVSQGIKNVKQTLGMFEDVVMKGQKEEILDCLKRLKSVQKEFESIRDNICDLNGLISINPKTGVREIRGGCLLDRRGYIQGKKDLLDSKGQPQTLQGVTVHCALTNTVHPAPGTTVIIGGRGEGVLGDEPEDTGIEEEAEEEGADEERGLIVDGSDYHMTIPSPSAVSPFGSGSQSDNDGSDRDDTADESLISSSRVSTPPSSRRTSMTAWVSNVRKGAQRRLNSSHSKTKRFSITKATSRMFVIMPHTGTIQLTSQAMVLDVRAKKPTLISEFGINSVLSPSSATGTSLSVPISTPLNSSLAALSASTIPHMVLPITHQPSASTPLPAFVEDWKEISDVFDGNSLIVTEKRSNMELPVLSFVLTYDMASLHPLAGITTDPLSGMRVPVCVGQPAVISRPKTVIPTSGRKKRRRELPSQNGGQIIDVGRTICVFEEIDEARPSGDEIQLHGMEATDPESGKKKKKDKKGGPPVPEAPPILLGPYVSPISSLSLNSAGEVVGVC